MPRIGSYRRGIVALLLALALASTGARGQEAPGPKADPRPALPDPTLDADFPPPKAVEEVDVVSAFAFAGVQFDQRFAGGRLADGQIRARLDGALAARLDRLATEHRLTPRETAKLRLAGKGDIKRLVDRIDAARSGFEAAKRRPETALPALEEIDRLATLYHAAPFDRGSLLAKTMAKIAADRGRPPGPALSAAP